MSRYRVRRQQKPQQVNQQQAVSVATLELYLSTKNAPSKLPPLASLYLSSPDF